MRKKRQKRKLTTLEQVLKYLNDHSRIIKEISRDFFKDADIGTRRHKDKKKYNRKAKYKKKYTDDI